MELPLIEIDLSILCFKCINLKSFILNMCPFLIRDVLTIVAEYLYPYISKSDIFDMDLELFWLERPVKLRGCIFKSIIIESWIEQIKLVNLTTEIEIGYKKDHERRYDKYEYINKKINPLHEIVIKFYHSYIIINDKKIMYPLGFDKALEIYNKDKIII